jgi:replicative superfamily II helicase
LPDHIRLTIETAFSKQIIKTLITTTTLMQGMNLPAKYLIARNPNLFIRRRKDSECLTAYEFANLRGRAGRLMKDFVGRVIILDESVFLESDNYLGKFEEKNVYCSYGERFNENKDQLLDILQNGEEISEYTQNNDLVVYIRQMILKYGDEALNRIKQVGIEITTNEFKDIEFQLKNLKVPVEICMKNPYWDPLTIDNFYRYEEWEFLPNSPFDKEFIKKLQSVLLTIEEISPFYYNKIIKKSFTTEINQSLLYLEDWSREIPLKNILRKTIKRRQKNPEDIDNILDDIWKKSYSIPKLLKPILDIQKPNNPILSFVEMGAYSPLPRRLIEFGIPRETALKIKNIVKEKYSENYINEELDDNLIVDLLKKIEINLNYWEKTQINSLIS